MPPSLRMPVVAGLAVGPHLAAGRRVERVELVPSGDIHDAVEHDRRGLERARIAGNRKHPRGAKPLQVRPIDLLEQAVPVSRQAAVVVCPVRLRRNALLAVHRAVLREERESAALQQHGRQFRLSQQDARPRASVGHLYGGRRHLGDNVFRWAARRRWSDPLPRAGPAPRFGPVPRVGPAPLTGPAPRPAPPPRLPVNPPVAIAGFVPVSVRITARIWAISASGRDATGVFAWRARMAAATSTSVWYRT